MKKASLFLTVFFTLTAALLACFGRPAKPPVQQALALYRSDATAFAASVDSLLAAAQHNSAADVQRRFLQCRLAYKKIEWLLAYYNPHTAKQINGAPIAEVEPSDKQVVVEPEGLQVVEAFLFPTIDTAAQPELLRHLRMLRSTAGRVTALAATLETTDAHVLDALRLQLFRTVAMGLSGFDSPLAGNTVAETRTVLEATERYSAPHRNAGKSDNRQAAGALANSLQQALAFLTTATDATLNKALFIRAYLNPASANLVALQKALRIPFFTEPRPLRADAPTLFAPGVFNAAFYGPDAAAEPNAATISLGERLFADAVLSEGGSRSCASCHQPQKAFTDGAQKAASLSGNGLLKRNTPTLLNAALQPALFYDMRVSFLEDQAAEVIRNRDEMHGDFATAAKALQADAGYQKQFAAAFGNGAVTEAAIKTALAAYLRSLVRFATPFDRYMQGEAGALSPQAVQGFNLFMGKAKCGTCHFLPLFNGVNPPEFTRTDAEVIGVPASADTLRPTLDSDEGRHAVHGITLHRFAFKTPTLRNVALTAPYMHNGVYKTLDEVMDFYNRGGGAGLGLPLQNQTLSPEPLGLTPAEQKAVVAFLHALTDERVEK